MHSHFLRIKKLKGKEIILVAAKHNLREIQAENGLTKESHIDPRRTPFNTILRGLETALQVAKLAQCLLDDAEIKPLKVNAVRGLEIIFSLPPTTQIDVPRYFGESTKWTEQYFNAPVISSIIHLDEGAPHCHVIILPLVGGRMNGSDMMGGKPRLIAMQADYHEQVGKHHGLKRQSKRPSNAIRQEAALTLLNAIKANPTLLNRPDVASSLLESLAENPEPFLMALGLEMPKKAIKEKSFVEIMTKPQKPEKPEQPYRDRKNKQELSENYPIGIEPKNTQDIGRKDKANSPNPMLCRDRNLKQSIQAVTMEGETPIEAVKELLIGGNLKRVMEADNQINDADHERISANYAAGEWSDELGEWIPHPVKQSKKLYFHH